MVFNEIYGSYFRAVGAILTEAVKGPVTGNRIREIVQEKAFGESILTIPEALRAGRWPLLDAGGRAVLRSAPKMPLTGLQKRWLKSLLMDPRIALFQPSAEGLENGEPLFTPDMFVYFDQYADGDPYERPEYQEHFHVILTAIRERRKLVIRQTARKGREVVVKCAPYQLEYSLKDDKFRLVGAAGRYRLTVNVARIISCRYAEKYDPKENVLAPPVKKELEMILTDERNAMERCMLHFSDFEKMTEKMDDVHYHFLIRYDSEDETEILIRVLSFGPRLQVVSPDSFKEKIKERLLRQRSGFPGGSLKNKNCKEAQRDGI